ncbi:MAG: hypothetical protein KBT48_05540 [Firmicutes bacterium]|nr:hypothetical protein [Bacillota bacterium]
MFEKGHYERLFDKISALVSSCNIHVFTSDRHPVLISNISEYIHIYEEFVK